MGPPAGKDAAEARRKHADRRNDRARRLVRSPSTVVARQSVHSSGNRRLESTSRDPVASNNRRQAESSRLPRARRSNRSASRPGNHARTDNCSPIPDSR